MTTRKVRLIGVVLTLFVVWPATGSLAQDGDSPEKAEASASPLPPRVRVVLNAAAWVGSSPSYGDTRTYDEYAEQTTIRSSYETGSAFGLDAAVQVTLYRSFGLRVGFSSASRDGVGSLDASRPHPLYFDRPRTAATEQADLSYSERAVHLDLAYGGTSGQLDWSLFAGATLFRVEADVFGDPVFDDVYPFDELSIARVPTVTAESSPVGFNVGAGLDYRFGRSGRFGLGAQVVYSRANAELGATGDAEPSTFEAGGLQVAAGLRLYF